ncbi:PilN domain-containing protein [Photobacterium leiognathi]|uniref:PilN domain-containing protein n=1 Tax=Photobacterium leiognathi TaxID=553611 RepID=UPI0029825D91|nr:PilN domain-containing protein [Photobacterium leiognathi]
MMQSNILDWRKKDKIHRESNNKKVIILAIFITFILNSIVIIMFNSSLNDKIKLNKYISGEVKKLQIEVSDIEEDRKKISELKNNLKVLDDIKQERKKITQFIDDLSHLTPEQTYIKKMKYDGNYIEIYGLTSNMSLISNFLNNINGTMHFYDTRIIKTDIIKKHGYNDIVLFKIKSKKI